MQNAFDADNDGVEVEFHVSLPCSFTMSGESSEEKEVGRPGKKYSKEAKGGSGFEL